jgi:hypothetical protein
LCIPSVCSLQNEGRGHTKEGCQTLRSMFSADAMCHDVVERSIVNASAFPELLVESDGDLSGQFRVAERHSHRAQLRQQAVLPTSRDRPGLGRRPFGRSRATPGCCAISARPLHVIDSKLESGAERLQRFLLPRFDVRHTSDHEKGL